MSFTWDGYGGQRGQYGPWYAQTKSFPIRAAERIIGPWEVLILGP